ncbi:MAG: 8-amino-7-oxononanoate synthase [Prochlorococcaceae cyanobacterium ETNP7_MAG_30]|nr:8-amino-7-oxononanoate synthase [Prochlorococcaceae cyanobacterium ETNP18_MAG_17]MDP7327006.1 8-amino-7-oxononanoate synthase [Prochlorococcaceae cyanobacterium ETNP7_MAG_30]
MQSPPPARRRQLRTWHPGPGPTELKAVTPHGKSEPLLDLASNDYLGLCRHPELIKAAQAALHSEGVGAGGSRLVTGSRPVHVALEDALAKWLGRERVLLFPSGFQANLAAVIALANRNTPVLADRLVHHSLLVGVKASGARLQRYAHNDLADLNHQLERCRHQQPNQPPLVLTESLFSMEGTSPPLKAMAELCERHGARLLVDEAHALGVIGPQGRGLCHGLSAPVTIISGTFGKAFGSGGAFLAGDSAMGEHLLQNSGAFRYTTALAPPLAAAALSALTLIEAHPYWGEQLQQHAEQWRSQLAAKGWTRPPGHGPILSLIIGADQQALDRQSQLEEAGLLSIAIRPPTVPEGTARLRLVLRRDLPNETLGRLLAALDAQ